jgi:hypothetical protein
VIFHSYVKLPEGSEEVKESNIEDSTDLTTEDLEFLLEAVQNELDVLSSKNSFKFQ